MSSVLVFPTNGFGVFGTSRSRQVNLSSVRSSRRGSPRSASWSAGGIAAPPSTVSVVIVATVQPDDRHARERYRV
jgi:hypothetical protein